jgi:hypothetical protein
MGATWAQVLGMLLILFFIRPFGSDMAVVFKTVLIMGLVGNALKIISIDWLTGWANDAGDAVSATVIASSLVAVGLNFAIQQADIPFLPDSIEQAMRYVIYVVGGALMYGSTEWAGIFADLIGLLAGGQNTGGILGIVGGIIDLLTLGLQGK